MEECRGASLGSVPVVGHGGFHMVVSRGFWALELQPQLGVRALVHRDPGYSQGCDDGPCVGGCNIWKAY